MNSLDFSSSTTRVMGVLNTTPDSFFDGGCYSVVETALKRARQMCLEGVDIIDIGGESTRPGAPAVDLEEEIRRVVPVIRAIKRDPLLSAIPISVDTSKASVMHSAIEAGASLVNDIRALANPSALEVCAKAGVQVCLMHMQGKPGTMQNNPFYSNVTDSVAEFLHNRVQVCLSAGILPDRILLDPGFGFGKTLEHNLSLLAGLEKICKLGFPVLVGLSRKSMLGEILGVPAEDRLYGSIAAAVLAVERGARVVRTHDIKATVQAIKVVDRLVSVRN